MRTLVAIDPGAQAEHVVAAAAPSLRQMHDPHICLVTVVDDSDIHESTTSTSPQGTTTPLGSSSGSSYRIPQQSSPRFAEDRGQALARVHGELEARNRSLATQHLEGLDVECRVVSGATAAAAILESAADFRAELIVVGTRGRRGLSRMLMGSTAEGLIRESLVPVVVVGDAVRQPAS